MTDPSPLKPKKSGRVGPAPTVISSNLKTMRKVKAADAEAAPETPGGPAKKYKVKAKPEKALSATEKMRARAEAEERQKGQRLTDLSVKEQSYVAATLGKLLKKISRPRVRLVHPKAIEMCDALGLGQWHLRILKEKFEEIDVDNSGNIDPEEFFESMDEARSMLTDELFRVMDLDGNQRIEFDEFVAVSLVYCMYTKDDILKFCFDLFDLDSGGTIDEKEFIEMCKNVNSGDPLFTGNFRNALLSFDLNADGLIDFDEFKALNDRYPLVLHPAFRMQDKLQKNTLGEHVWVKVMENVAHHMRIAEYTEREGEPPPRSPLEAFVERYFAACGFGHPAVDLDFLAAQAKAKAPKKKDDDSDDDDDDKGDGGEQKEGEPAPPPPA
jgi:Ca2+-binding EF-hand superfamily protein